MTEQQADFILLVLELSSDFYKRNQCDDSDAVIAAQKIAARYSELKETLDYASAARKAKREFLTSISAGIAKEV